MPTTHNQATALQHDQNGIKLSPSIRFSRLQTQFDDLPTDCPTCLGIGAPLINIEDQLSIGLSSTNADIGRRYHLNDVVSWQRSLHHIRFGGDWETTRGGHTGVSDEPLTLNLFAPTSVRDFNSQQPPDSQIPLPATFLTVPDILRLPMQNFTTGIGDPFVPKPDLEERGSRR